MEKSEFRKLYVIALFLILIFVSYLMIKPYITALLTSMIFAYLFFPIYKKFRSITKNEVISSLLVTFLVIIIIILPLGFIASAIVKESANIIKENRIENLISNLAENPQLKSIIGSASQSGLEYLRKQASEFLLSLPLKIISLVISAFALFYLLIIGEPLVNTIKETLPVKKREELINHIGNSIYSIVYGLFATALIEFVVAAIGFKLLGVESPILFAFLIGLFALIPFLGPLIVWLPLSIIEILHQSYPKAIGIAILGSALSLSENLIRAKIIGDKSKIHPLVIILGVVGGVPLMGFIGIIVGPIILSILIIVFKEYYPIEHEAES